MTIELVGVGALDSDIGVTANVTPTLHASTTEGHLILVCVAGSHDGTGDEVVDALSGYELLGSSLNTREQAYLFGKIAGASESDPNVTTTNYDADAPFIGQCATFSGTLDEIASILAHSITLESVQGLQDIALPALTVTTDNTLIIALGYKRENIGTSALSDQTGVSWTEIIEIGSSAGSDISLVVNFGVQTTATSISSGEFDVTDVGTDRSGGIMLSLKEAEAAPPDNLIPASFSQQMVRF